MITRRLIAAASLLACLAGCTAEPSAGGPVQPAALTRSAAGLDIIPLRIRTSTATHDFKVEVARSAEEQGYGMMFRESVGPDEGMLFPFDPPRLAGFYMKNTVIPLDMIFVRANGSIARIAANTTPYSLETVLSGEPVAAVLEIGGGRSAELGIAEGDKVSWPGGPSL